MSETTLPENPLWDYTPSLPAAIITIVVFGILTVYHVFRLFKTRTWFCIPLVVGGFFEVIGYAGRAVAHTEMISRGPRIIESLFILLAPILFAASVYMVLGRLIRATSSESYSLIRPTWITKIFVGGDILCFLVQAAGGGLLASAETLDARQLGQNVILAGLILQIVVFAFFLVVAVVYHRRLVARSTHKLGGLDFNWKLFMKSLYGASILITFRNLFRVIEYGIGEGNYLLINEWPIYVFDAVPMAIVLGVCSLWYIGSFQKSEQHVDLQPIHGTHSV